MDAPCGSRRDPGHIELVTLVVDCYDPAVAFFVDVLGFDLVDDSPR